MVTIPDNIPEIPGFQKSAYKGLELMSEPGTLKEYDGGRSDCDSLHAELWKVWLPSDREVMLQAHMLLARQGEMVEALRATLKY